MTLNVNDFYLHVPERKLLLYMATWGRLHVRDHNFQSKTPLLSATRLLDMSGPLTSRFTSTLLMICSAAIIK